MAGVARREKHLSDPHHKFFEVCTNELLYVCFSNQKESVFVSDPNKQIFKKTSVLLKKCF